MTSLIEQVDKALADLAWSLWSCLGVKGVNQEHKDCLIGLEELIILTAVIAKSDPRLRDEALDWCSKYHHLVSVSRLRTLVNGLGDLVYEPFSLFAVTLNSVVQTKWPVFKDVSPIHVKLSGKSSLVSFKEPALLNLRLRAVFGVGIRADLLAFCLTRGANKFTAMDAARIGYNKRSISDVLESLVFSGILTMSTIGNRREYALSKVDELHVFMGSLPTKAPDWYTVFEVFIALRTNLLESMTYSYSSKIITVRNVLKQLESKLNRLNLSTPPLTNNIEEYWDSFSKWLLDIVRGIGQSNFWGGFPLFSIENIERQVCGLVQNLFVVQDDIDGLEFTNSCATTYRDKHKRVFKENYAYVLMFLKDLLKSVDQVIKFPVYALLDYKLMEILHRFERNEFPIVKKEIETFLAIETIPDPNTALRQYQTLEQLLNKFRGFMFEFTEELKKFYFYNTDVHLLTLSTKLQKRHLIMKLFSMLDD